MKFDTYSFFGEALGELILIVNDLQEKDDCLHAFDKAMRLKVAAHAEYVSFVRKMEERLELRDELMGYK